MTARAADPDLRVSRASLWVALIGVVLGTVAVIGWIWSESVLPPAVFTGQAVACLTAAAILDRRRPKERPRRLPDLSYPILSLAVGITMMLNGVVFGLWLVLMGAGLVVLGLGGLVRELIASRGVP